MNVDEAIAVVDDIASKLAAIGLPVWRDALCESTSAIRTHLTRKVDDAMVERADKWKICTSNHDMGNGEEIRCHINVGVNYWKNGHWEGFTQCSPDELKAALIAALGGDDEA